MKAKKIEELDRNLKAVNVKEPERFRWVSATDDLLTVRGLAWFKENGRRFCRLPMRAEKIVRPPVWDLAQNTAGARVAFRSNTTELAVRMEVDDTGYMSHMATTGSRGLCLFCGTPGNMRPWATAVPDQGKPFFERPLFQGIPGGKMREFHLYLPLYKGVKSLHLGFGKGARILKPSPFALEKPVVFYGTSITQGGCASTTGSDFVSSIGRQLNLDVINLGFSGNGRGEPELAHLVREIDASLYVLDYVSNADEKTLKRTLPGFVRILREKRPTTPILLMSSLGYWGMDFNRTIQQSIEARRDFMMGFYAGQRKRGDRHIHFADGLGLIPYGVTGCFVDGAHPTDHGFQTIADRLAPVVERILLRDN